jgi:bifunctional DNA-binding transcriptional regulator/antitoxin component of YhaV-PrlF toxin-antitoxin module
MPMPSLQTHRRAPLSESLIFRHSEASMTETIKVGKRGTVVLPAKLLRRSGIEEGTIVVAEESPYGILIRPAAVVPIEIYTSERKAEFLLSNAGDDKDYRAAKKEVQRLGLDPKKVRHKKPRKAALVARARQRRGMKETEAITLAVEETRAHGDDEAARGVIDTNVVVSGSLTALWG